MKQQPRLSEDEIIRDWSLSTDDSIFIKKFRKQYQLWGFLQVCALRLFGQLLDNPNTLDTGLWGVTEQPTHLRLLISLNFSINVIYFNKINVIYTRGF